MFESDVSGASQGLRLLVVEGADTAAKAGHRRLSRNDLKSGALFALLSTFALQDAHGRTQGPQDVWFFAKSFVLIDVQTIHRVQNASKVVTQAFTVRTAAWRC